MTHSFLFTVFIVEITILFISATPNLAKNVFMFKVRPRASHIETSLLSNSNSFVHSINVCAVCFARALSIRSFRSEANHHFD